MDVKLSASEVLLCAQVGCLHHVTRLYGGSSDKHGFERSGMDPWGTVIESRAAEYAVAKTAGTFWIVQALADPRGARDVTGWHVRSTALPHGSLILHEDDPDDARFVLVVGQIPSLRIAGWIIARDGKTDAYWRGDPGVRRAAWFVPQPALIPWTERDVIG